MRKTFLAILATVGIAASFASCKTNTNDLPNKNITQSSNARMPANGEVTDKNGIIGDSDDFVIGGEIHSYDKSTDRTGNIVNNAAHNAGDIIDNATRNAGNVINNAADKVGDTVQNITDNVGNTIKQATK